jgi:hypothetical protein
MRFRSHLHARDEAEPDPPRTAHPLFWLLVLVAVLTIVWSLYNRYASGSTPALVQPVNAAPASRPAGRLVDRASLRPGRDARPTHR